MGTPNVPPVVTWSLVTVGAWLMYASIRGVSPLGELNAALRGTPAPAPQSLTGASSATSTDTTPAYQGAPFSGEPDVTAPGLVSIGQGSHRLVKAAAAGFAAWQAAFGRTIPITDSYRSYAQQAAGYAQDPVRFAAPGKSWHVKGLAVDVNLQAVGANANGNASQKATWQALYNAAVATGWCNPRGPYKGDHAEPWHFSFGGCG